MITLVKATDAHFAWLLGEAPPPDGLILPPGGVEKPGVLRWLRRRLAVGASHWLMVADGEVVGLCSFKGPANAEGVLELGYGVAPERRRRGHALAAVACLVEVARGRPGLAGLMAETATTNIASAKVLEANGFSRAGVRTGPEYGVLMIWRRGL